MDTARIKEFATILKTIPQETWDTIVKMEPEWKYIGPFLREYGFGKFIVLMIMIGLNSYQLKGQAEQKYWFALQQHLSIHPVPDSKQEMRQVLHDFYQKERLPTGKIKRLHRFLSSTLAEDLWTCTPQEVIDMYENIWCRLAHTMKQKKNAKTICFSMKCLHVSVLLSNHYFHPCSSIPIPVDSRIIKFTEKMECMKHCSQDNIQLLWMNVLECIQRSQPKISMTHLDSLIWQIGNLDKEQLHEYFISINQSKLPYQFNAFFR